MDNFDYKKYLAEGKLFEEELQDDLFVKAGFSFEDGLLGGVGSGGGGYYDYISDKISGFNLDKFDEREFDKWYDNFSKEDFNDSIYDQEDMEDHEIDPSGLPKGTHQLFMGAGEVLDGRINIYAYPHLDSYKNPGTDMQPVFTLSKDGRVVPTMSKDEAREKLISNEYSLI
mgnify:CR=1 FL=1